MHLVTFFILKLCKNGYAYFFKLNVPVSYSSTAAAAGASETVKGLI